jgi:sec-independent protein translocase protein TatC
MGVSMAGGITFLLPMFIRLIATMGLVTADTMRKYRRHAAVILLIFAAIITPPDVFSQILIFVPCFVMYELGIRIAARIDAQRAKELANAYAATPSAAIAEDDDEVEDRETVRYDD